jgi:hypothetical protein
MGYGRTRLFPRWEEAGLNVEDGFAVIDVLTGTVQVVPMKNTCVPDSCYWTDYLPVYWLPDSRSFYTLTTINDYWDERSETTLSQVHVEPVPVVETITLIHAHPGHSYFHRTSAMLVIGINRM